MLEPKYKIGDKVWKIVHNKATEVTVFAVALSKDWQKVEKYLYNAGEENSNTTSAIYCFDNDQTIFPTREELIASL